MSRTLPMLKVKGLDIYIPPLTGKPWPAAVYNSKWRTYLFARMNGLWTPQSAARQTHLCPSQPHYG